MKQCSVALLVPLRAAAQSIFVDVALGGIMPSKEQKPAVVTQFYRKLRGGSQAILAKASDGKVYVVKFRNNPQGPHLLFNESMGTELYRTAGLPVPAWRPLTVTRQFVEFNRGCWMQSPDGLIQPQTGLCFGSRFVGGDNIRLYEVLPVKHIESVRNRLDFWQAWLLDVCAAHADNRQAIFRQEGEGHYNAVFIDHGHMFCSPKGNVSPHFIASRYYLDPRIYPNVCSEIIRGLRKRTMRLDLDGLWAGVLTLPDEWMTRSAVSKFAECLHTLADSHSIERVIDMITNLQNPAKELWQHDLSGERQSDRSILRPGIQGGRNECPVYA